MSLSALDLPSNKKFGFFFTGIFFLVACYCWFYVSDNTTFAFLAISAGMLLITLFAMIMRVFKRDELRLRFVKKNSHWIKRDAPLQYDSFKNQF